MMREILFKAKRIDNGEWVYGNYAFCDCYLKQQDYIFQNKPLEYAIDKNTLCQYTGLKDKNGKKIWENDIVFDDELCSLVIWDELSARFVVVDYGTKGCLMEYGFDEYAGEYGVVDTNGFDDFCDDANVIFEVIGNRFDNPELLERGD